MIRKLHWQTHVRKSKNKPQNTFSRQIKAVTSITQIVHPSKTFSPQLIASSGEE